MPAYFYIETFELKSLKISCLPFRLFFYLFLCLLFLLFFVSCLYHLLSFLFPSFLFPFLFFAILSSFYLIFSLSHFRKIEKNWPQKVSNCPFRKTIEGVYDVQHLLLCEIHGNINVKTTFILDRATKKRATRQVTTQFHRSNFPRSTWRKVCCVTLTGKAHGWHNVWITRLYFKGLV